MPPPYPLLGMEEIDLQHYVLPALLAPLILGTFPVVVMSGGDTPTSIADRAGIFTERLLELNPSIDPSALKPGQTLKLAR